MSEIKDLILHNIFPDHDIVINVINSYTDYELRLIKDYPPDNIDVLRDMVIDEIQWDIFYMLFSPFIKDSDKFYEEHENEIMDFCSSCRFLDYNDNNRSYEISETNIIELSNSFVSDIDPKYSINNNVDMDKIMGVLNSTYPIKFCKVE